MSYEEKGSWVYLIVVTGTCAAYVITILNRADGALTDVAYRAPMLWSMGISIVLAMAGRMLLEMVRPSETYRTDVRDRDIGRYGDYVSGSVLAGGMLVGFVLALAAADHFWIANTMYLAFAAAAIVGAAVRVVAYRWGLRAWVSQPG